MEQKRKKNLHLNRIDIKNINKRYIDDLTAKYTLNICFDNNVTKSLFYNYIDVDPHKRIKLREELCAYEKYNMFDLSFIDSLLVCKFFDMLSKTSSFCNVEHLFLNNCELSSLPNLSSLHSLKTLDISHNKFTTIPTLPKKLIELAISHNYVVCNTTDVLNVETLDISNNNLKILPSLPNIKSLDISYNLIAKCDTFYEKLNEFDCDSNPIETLPVAPKLESLDCSNTKVRKIEQYPNLTVLTANDLLLDKVNDLPALVELYLVGSELEFLPYINTLQLLVITHLTLHIDESYVILSQHKNKQGAVEIFF